MCWRASDSDDVYVEWQAVRGDCGWWAWQVGDEAGRLCDGVCAAVGAQFLGMAVFGAAWLAQCGQTTPAFLSAISFRNAVKVWPQCWHKTSTVGSPIVFRTSQSIQLPL